MKRQQKQSRPAADGLLGRLLAVDERATRSESPAAAELLERGLAERGMDGRLRPTEAGRARSRRLRGGDNPYLAQHADLERRVIEHEGSRTEILVDTSESPLAWLAKRRGKDGLPLLGAAAFQAGERFRAHLTLARTMPRVTSSWNPVAGDRKSGGGGAAEMSDAVASARQRVGRALDAVGPELGGILVDVCGFLKGLEEVERERRWPPRTAKVVLGLALDRLAGHYGLADAGRGPGSSRTRVWHAPEESGSCS